MDAYLYKLRRSKCNKPTCLINCVKDNWLIVIHSNIDLLTVRVIVGRYLNVANLIFHIDSIRAIRGQKCLRISVIEDWLSVDHSKIVALIWICIAAETIAYTNF